MHRFYVWEHSPPSPPSKPGESRRGKLIFYAIHKHYMRQPQTCKGAETYHELHGMVDVGVGLVAAVKKAFLVTAPLTNR